MKEAYLGSSEKHKGHVDHERVGRVHDVEAVDRGLDVLLDATEVVHGVVDALSAGAPPGYSGVDAGEGVGTEETKIDTLVP